MPKLKKRPELARLCVRLPFSYFNGQGILHRTCTIAVHRLILMSAPGFKFKDGYVIHHINADHFDNRLCNLEYLTPSEHNRKTALTQHLWTDKIVASRKKTINSEEWKAAHKDSFNKKRSEWLKMTWKTNPDLFKSQNKGMKHYNNGKINKMFKENPGEGWTLGMLKKVE